MADEKKIEGCFILDSSVIIKWFCEEEGTKIALAFREGHIKGELEIIIPDLMLYEIANALRYNKSVNENDVKEAVNSLISLGIDIVVPTKEVMDEAISLAFKFDITLYDAYFIALAKVLQFTCVTADEKLVGKVKELSFIKLLKNFLVEDKNSKEKEK